MFPDLLQFQALSILNIIYKIMKINIKIIMVERCFFFNDVFLQHCFFRRFGEIFLDKMA